ncbi:MAG: ATP-binding protein [Streptosporangiales bacterium]|nr:ATP-binding protein [Streptosporangiales bacterium]
MLVWINGPFGGGKTQTAYEIHRRLPGSVVCDPEHVGFGLHRMTPPRLRGDFQEIIGRLGERGHKVRHFALLAERETVLRRLRERGFGHAVAFVAGKDAPLRRESFAVSKLDRCLERLSRPEFAVHVWTDRLTVPQVAESAESIAGSVGLLLTPNTDGALREQLRRAWTGIRHIRFG